MKDFIRTIKNICVEDLLLQFGEISVDMFRKHEYIRNVNVPVIFNNGARKILTVQLSAWDIHSIEYYAICNSNDYRKNTLKYPIGQIVDLYREFEDINSSASDLENADLSGVFKILFGIISEQLPFEDMAWIFENFNRNYHILIGSSKINRHLPIGLEQIIKEKFNWSVDEYLSVQLIVFWLCMQHCNPLSAPEELYRKKEDTVLTKTNVQKFIKYYSCSYSDVRSSPIQKQIFISRPFIHTEKSKDYLASNSYLVCGLISNSLYWLLRDYYNDLNSQDFLNAFGTMFEDYLKELSEKYFSKDQWHVIPVSNKKNDKSADFYFDLGDAIFVIEQKSSLIRLTAKQQVPDLNALSKFISNTIIEAYGQIQSTCMQLSVSKPVIKVILLYETIQNTSLIESAVPEIFGKDDNCYIMTILEVEIMFYLWSVDKEKCSELIQKMLTSKKENILHSSSISNIYKEMNLYALHGIGRELTYFQSELAHLGEELGQKINM